MMVASTIAPLPTKNRRPQKWASFRKGFFSRGRYGGWLVPEWNLVVPLEVLQRSWATVT